MKVKLKIETSVIKAKDALNSNKLIVDGVEYDICGVREVEPGTLTFFTMIFNPKAETVFKQFVLTRKMKLPLKTQISKIMFTLLMRCDTITSY